MKTTLVLITIIFSQLAFAQQEDINWLSFEEAEAKSKIDPRPILIDVYTDWCGWCKHLDKTTYKDPQIVSFLNNQFYAVKFNAETSDTIIFEDNTYVNPKPGAKRSTHQLAGKLMPGRRSYPTTIFMDENLQTPLIAPGYFSAEDMAPFLVFYNEKIYRDANVNDYSTLFKDAFKADTITKPSVKFLSLSNALETNKTSKKKLFVFLDDQATVSSRVMDSTNFRDPNIYEYISNNFVASKFNTRSSDTIVLNNQALINNPTDGPYHQLILAALKENIKFPACLIFDENNLLITPIPQYMTPEFMLPVLIFFNEDKYKEMQFPDFLKSYQANQAK